MKIYIYKEYNDSGLYESAIMVSTDIEKLKGYLKDRVKRFFGYDNFAEIKDRFGFCNGDIFSDTFVSYKIDTDKSFSCRIVEANTI